MLSSDLIKAAIEGEDLLYVGTVALEKEPDFARFKDWLDQRLNAGMSYLEKYLELREDPRLLLTGARSAAIFAIAYGQGDKLFGSKTPKIAQYARLKDYHSVMRRRGERVLVNLQSEHADHLVGRVVVDTAPILERALAARTGNGFVGKNTLFIHPRFGSFLLLGEIILNVEITEQRAQRVDPSVRSERGGCGSCRRCQSRCPTGALDEAYRLDANKCIAYWTIEHRGTLPEAVWPWLKHYVFGCDICQLVCPYNRADSQSAVQKTAGTLLKITVPPTLEQMAMMTQDNYEAWFGGTPMTRAKREGLMRNALVAMHVTKNSALPAVLDNLSTRTDVPPVVAQTIAQIKTTSP